MSAANSLFPFGLCCSPCYGTLAQTSISGELFLVCQQCGELTSPPDERTEADVDLFLIQQGQASVAELEPMRWHPNRDEYDVFDDKSDLLPWTRTTHY